MVWLLKSIHKQRMLKKNLANLNGMKVKVIFWIGFFGCLDKLNSAQSSIKSVRDKLIDMLVYLNNKKDYINSIDKNISGEFEKTYSSLNPTDMLLATRKLADIYEIIGREFAKRNNISFPDAKLTTTKALFNEFDNLYKEIVVLTS